MKTQNRYDILIDNLTSEFAKLPNIGLLQTDPKARVIFDFVIKRQAEILSFKTLFSNYYIPVASKSVIDDLREISKSKYKHIIKLTKEDLKENYYETIRLGYIGMFHKYESYVNDLINNAELLISDLNDDKTPLEPFLKTTFGFDIRKWHKSKNIKRIHWISNCNKHNDGYPKKEFRPAEFTDYPETEKLKLTKEDFVKDISLLMDFYTTLLQVILNLAIYKMLDTNVIDLDSIDDDMLKQNMVQSKNELKNKMVALIEIL